MEMWAVAWFVMLPYLFHHETVIAFCVYLGSGQRRNREDVMFCNLCYEMAR